MLDNIFVDCFKSLHVDARGLTWSKRGFPTLKEKLEHRPYKTPPWSERFPELCGILEDEPMAPKNTFIARNVFVTSPWDDIDREADPYVTLEHNLFDAPREILVSEPDRMPRLGAESELLRAMRFEPPAYDKIGLYQSPARRTWPGQHSVQKIPWDL